MALARAATLAAACSSQQQASRRGVASSSSASLRGSSIASTSLPRPAASTRSLVVCQANKPLHSYTDRNLVDLSSTPGIKFYKVEAIIRPWRLDYVLKARGGPGGGGGRRAEDKKNFRLRLFPLLVSSQC